MIAPTAIIILSRGLGALIHDLQQLVLHWMLDLKFSASASRPGSPPTRQQEE